MNALPLLSLFVAVCAVTFSDSLNSNTPVGGVDCTRFFDDEFCPGNFDCSQYEYTEEFSEGYCITGDVLNVNPAPVLGDWSCENVDTEGNPCEKATLYKDTFPRCTPVPCANPL